MAQNTMPWPLRVARGLAMATLISYILILFLPAFAFLLPFLVAGWILFCFFILSIGSSVCIMVLAVLFFFAIIIGSTLELLLIAGGVGPAHHYQRGWY
jgi:hypothetical protein